jgi:membrane protein implicated in regulation of membrane protease activity
MLHALRQYTPFLIGCGVLLLCFDVAILLYRALGLDKGTAIYAALLTVLSVGYVLIWRYFTERRASTHSQSAERQGNE